MDPKAAALSFLKSEQLPFEEAGADLWRVAGTAPGDEWMVVVQCGDDDVVSVFSVYAVSTAAVPPDQRARVMELVTRINYGLQAGCFELDVDDGELRTRASVDFEGATASASLVRNVFFIAVALMQRYLPAVVAVIDGGAPVDVLSDIEASPPQSLER
jgi:hypothetical protein